MMRHVARRYTRKLPKKKRSAHDDSKAPWDDTVSDLKAMQLTKEEQQRRRRVRESKNAVKSGQEGRAERRGSLSSEGAPDHDAGPTSQAHALHVRASASCMASTAPPRRAAPASPRSLSPSIGYQSDGAVDFEAEVRSFQEAARSGRRRRAASGSQRQGADDCVTERERAAPSASAQRMSQSERQHPAPQRSPCLSQAHMRPPHSLIPSQSGSAATDGAPFTPGFEQRATTRAHCTSLSQSTRKRAAALTATTGLTPPPAVVDASLLERAQNPVPVQVDALERQMLGVGTLRSLVREVQASVDKLAAAQGTLRADVESHCSHSSALLTQLQAQMSSVLMGGGSPIEHAASVAPTPKGPTRIRTSDQHAPFPSVGARPASASGRHAADGTPEDAAARHASAHGHAPALSSAAGHDAASAAPVGTSAAGGVPHRPVSAQSDESWSALDRRSALEALHAAASASDAIEAVEVDHTPLSGVSDLPFASASEAAAAGGSPNAALLDSARLRASAAIDTLLEVGNAARGAPSRADSDAAPQNKYLQRLQWPPVQAAVRERSWLHERLDQSLAVSASSSGLHDGRAAEPLPLRDANVAAAPPFAEQHESAWSGFTTLRSARDGAKLGGLAFGEDSAEDLLQENVTPAATAPPGAAHWTSVASQGATLEDNLPSFAAFRKAKATRGA